jgi:hypothetical protein
MRLAVATIVVLLAGCTEPASPMEASELAGQADGAGQEQAAAPSGSTTTRTPAAPPAGASQGAGGSPANLTSNGTGGAPATLSAFRQSFDLLVNPDPEAIAVGGASRNCVLFWDSEGTDLSIHNGTARLTWSETPNTPAFRITSATTAGDPASPYGDSPVEWSFEALLPASGDEGPGWGLGFGADYTLADGTIPVAQAMTLELAFTYTGTLPEAGVGTCSGGGV